MNREINKDVYEQYLTVLQQRDDAIELLRQAMEWIERPVEDQEDAAMFIYFEEKVKIIL